MPKYQEVCISWKADSSCGMSGQGTDLVLCLCGGQLLGKQEAVGDKHGKACRAEASHAVSEWFSFQLIR